MKLINPHKIVSQAIQLVRNALYIQEEINKVIKQCEGSRIQGGKMEPGDTPKPESHMQEAAPHVHGAASPNMQAPFIDWAEGCTEDRA